MRAATAGTCRRSASAFCCRHLPPATTRSRCRKLLSSFLPRCVSLGWPGFAGASDAICCSHIGRVSNVPRLDSRAREARNVPPPSMLAIRIGVQEKLRVADRFIARVVSFLIQTKSTNQLERRRGVPRLGRPKPWTVSTIKQQWHGAKQESALSPPGTGTVRDRSRRRQDPRCDSADSIARMRMNGGSTTSDVRMMQIRNIAPTESGFAASGHVEHPYLNLPLNLSFCLRTSRQKANENTPNRYS